MAEIVREKSNSAASKAGTTIAVIALIIALFAMGLAWLAYNRSGEDLENQVQQEVQQQIESAGDEVEEAGDEIEENTDQGADSVDENTQ